MTRLGDELVLLQGAGANVVAANGADGVLMVDGGLAEHSSALLDAVAELFGGARVHTLFNTHWHPQQTGSNTTLGMAGSKIVAHENTRLWLTTDVTWPWDAQTFDRLPQAAQPNDTFYTTATMTAGTRRVDVGYVARAHTDGDIYVFFPEENVLAAGGAVQGDGWAFIDWWTGAWIGGHVSGLETLLGVADRNTRIVPADGPVLTRADLERQREMYATVYGRLRDLLRSGRSPDEVIAAEPTKEFNAEMGDPEQFLRLAFQSLWGQMSPDA